MNRQRPHHMRPSVHATRQLRHRSTPIVATVCALAVVLAGMAAYGWHVGWFAKSTSDGNTATPQTSRTSALPRTDVPSPKKNDAPAAQALLVGFNNRRRAHWLGHSHWQLEYRRRYGQDRDRATPRICAGRQSSHHRHRSGGWSGTASDWYRFRHNAQCR